MRHEDRVVTANYEDGTTGEITLKYPVKEKDKCFIIGCAPSKDIVPWDDPDAEYWGVNNLYGVKLEGMHYDRWFEIHNIWHDARTNKLMRRGSPEFRGQPVDQYMAGMAQIGCSVYMQRHWQSLIPTSIPYPLEEVLRFFAERGFTLDMCRYLTNTISYEIALATYLGFKEIQVWGVDMAVGTEYECQRPSCEFWLGVAAGMGIKVFIPPQADLLKTRFLYGFEEKLQDMWHEKIERVRVATKLKRLELEKQVNEADKQIMQYKGAEQAISEIKKIWSNLQDDIMFHRRGTR